MMTLLDGSGSLTLAAEPEPVTRAPRPRVARLVLIAAAAWCAYVVAHLALSGRWWPMLFADFAPPLVFVAVPVALAAISRLARRDAWRVVVLAVTSLVLGWSQAGLNLQVPWEQSPAPPPQALHVVSWNPQYWEQFDDPQRMYDYLKSYDADVYLLQEYLHFIDATGTPIKIDELSVLKDQFPGYNIVAHGELLTMSRYPIESWSGLDGSQWLSDADGSAGPPGSGFPLYWTTKTLRTDIEVGGELVSFYNTHLPVQTNINISPFTSDFYRFTRIQAARREAAWEALGTDLDANPGPKVVAGDFNTTPAMGELSHLRDRLKEAPLNEGSIYPGTFDSTDFRLWRLDYVFTSPQIRTYRYAFRDDQDLSDHFAQELYIDPLATPRPAVTKPDS